MSKPLFRAQVEREKKEREILRKKEKDRARKTSRGGERERQREER